MSKAKIVRDSDGLFYGIKILCPGCLYSNGAPMDHVLPTHWLPPGETQHSPHISWKDRWSFNGDFDKPVFGPSLNTWWGGETYKRENGEEWGIPLHRCHSFIGCSGAQPGQITFLGDCTHALANQTVDLPDVDGDA
ncbi:hypothetical protein GCT13_08100 [Paraburkholderia sp. CNPSo 3157]|uniref:Ammonia monooxygenase n=1 Tax=Paraburkholderia franconis TaxID=2654983 RepID=A0A7X1N7M2_9BURK|nr:hypothetical protein [Paraburkholderia franconis]MPW16892.1 hypothetical protein [Paraburkholderia franconis]